MRKLKPIKVVAIEHRVDYEWELYDIIRNTTPIKAIRSYLKEYGLDHKQKIARHGYDNMRWYPLVDDDVVRAQVWQI